MSNRNFPFVVRLIGFAEQEIDAFDAIFAAEQGKGYRYARLEEGNLQDPDLYIANAGELRALVTLLDLQPSDIRPALLVGTPDVELPFPQVVRPLRALKLFQALDDLVEKRADALSRLEASDVVVVPERRRRNRYDIDLTDPAEYLKMRAKVAANGMVLIVDRNPAFRDHVGGLLGRYKVPVAWADNEVQAFELCQKQPTAMVMINTSTPDVDPYRLCRVIKANASPLRIAVIFLVGKTFVYDVRQAHDAGAEGFLYKPLSTPQLIGVLRKFLPQLR